MAQDGPQIHEADVPALSCAVAHERRQAAVELGHVGRRHHREVAVRPRSRQVREDQLRSRAEPVNLVEQRAHAIQGDRRRGAQNDVVVSEEQKDDVGRRGCHPAGDRPVDFIDAPSAVALVIAIDPGNAGHERADEIHVHDPVGSKLLPQIPPIPAIVVVAAARGHIAVGIRIAERHQGDVVEDHGDGRGASEVAGRIARERGQRVLPLRELRRVDRGGVRRGRVLGTGSEAVDQELHSGHPDVVGRGSGRRERRLNGRARRRRGHRHRRWRVDGAAGRLIDLQDLLSSERLRVHVDLVRPAVESLRGSVRAIVVARADRQAGDVRCKGSRMRSRELENTVHIQLDVGPIVGAREVDPLPQRRRSADREVGVAAGGIHEPATLAVLEAKVVVLVVGVPDLAREDRDDPRLSGGPIHPGSHGDGGRHRVERRGLGDVERIVYPVEADGATRLTGGPRGAVQQRAGVAVAGGIRSDRARAFVERKAQGRARRRSLDNCGVGAQDFDLRRAGNRTEHHAQSGGKTHECTKRAPRATTGGIMTWDLQAGETNGLLNRNA